MRSGAQVLVGDPVKMRQGDPKSVDTGTFLIRNSERSKQLLQQIADVADQFQAGHPPTPQRLRSSSFHASLSV